MTSIQSVARDQGGKAADVMREWRPGRRNALLLLAGAFGGFIAPLPRDGRAATIDGDETIDWTHAIPLLRPKLLPSYFVDAFPGLIHRNFSAKLVVAYAIDRGKTDEYIRETIFSPWGVTADDVHGKSLANLEAMSRELPPAPSREAAKGGAISISKGDGYDAARLLLPEMRARVIARLGAKMFAAVPARDLLLMWSADDPGRHDLVARTSRESASRPHSLSTEIFRVTADAVQVASAEELAR